MALHQLTNHITTGFNQKKPPHRTITIALDMSQAFDTVNHYTLIEKLINTNTPNLITRFIANYIRGRKAFTQYKNKNSFKKQFKAGVPQGGVLSPTLFNIYMSDLPTPPRDIHVTTYADDITIYSSDKNYTIAQQRLQPYLEDVQTWTKANDLKLNASKTMTTLFTPDPAEYRDELSLQLDNKRLPTIRNPKILGLTFDPKLTFNEHIKTLKDKAEKTINILKALTSTHWGKNKETLTNTYKTVTRPILEYAGTIYAPIISDKQLTALQVTQNQGLRIATGCTSDTNINHIHDETKILPIEKHLRLHSSQLRQKASHPDHPLHRLTTQPQPPRLKKKTIFNNNQYTLNIDPDPTHAIDENTIKRNMKTIHTTIVQDHLSNRPINKLLNRPPPDIDKKEETLPHSTRRKLSQLRTNKSPLLMTYLHKIDPANHPAANCPLCNDPNHDSLHLFNCPDIPTTLTVWDLWTNPVGVAALLDVWGEKLGGPRAGVWDPVRAHARDGVDTTTTKAIKQIKCGKATGVDGIPPEAWKHGGPALHCKLHELFLCCWEQGKLPQDLRDAVIITLYKNKGEKSNCDNYRGITLLSIAGKILARILLNRLVPTIAEDNTPESQCGFRRNRSTTDMVFVLRQLQEKCREQNKGLYVSFVDLTKAFDTVSRKGMWQIMERLGCPPRFLNMVILLHDDQRGQVRLNGDLSEPFAISNGVKQGCVLAPTLFSIFFSMMLRQATEDLNDDDSIYIRYRLDGNLFNLRRLQAHTKTQEQLIRDLLFADDAALVAHTERALQRLTSCFAEAAQLFGLEISLKKTEVLHQTAPQEEYHPPHISIDETELNTVHKFTYLGCTISSDAKIDKEINNRLAKANSAFGRLYKRVWGNKHLKNSTKISVYRAAVLTALLYGSESWVTYRCQLRILERFHQRCLRTILNIHWSEFVTNVEVLEQAKLTSIEAMLLKSQLRWVGHVSRMEDHRLPKIALYGERSSGHRNIVAPKKRYKDTLKKALGACDIDHHQWTTLAADRDTWRQTIHQTVSSVEENLMDSLKEKRHRRKTRVASVSIPDQTFTCNHCNRTCLSRIGFISHERACRRRGRPPS